MGLSVQFLNHINSTLDASAPIKDFFVKSNEELSKNEKLITPNEKRDQKNAGVEPIPSLFDMCVSKILEPEQDIDLSRQDGICQQRVLVSTKTFSNWTRIRRLCDDQVVKENCEALMERIRPGVQNAEDELLIYFFNEMVKNCTDQEKAKIILSKREVLPYKTQASDLIRARVEKIIDIVAKVLSNQWVRLAVGLIVGYYTWTLCWKVLALVQHLAIFKGLPLLINYAPPLVIKVVDVAVAIFKTIYHYPITTFLGAVISSAVMSMICPPLNRWVFKPISNLVFEIGFFWIRLFFRAISAAQYIHSASLTLGRKMDHLNRTWTDIRMGREMVQAREKWIELYKKERAEARAEVEAEYREQQQKALEAVEAGMGVGIDENG